MRLEGQYGWNKTLSPSNLDDSSEKFVVSFVNAIEISERRHSGNGIHFTVVAIGIHLICR